MHLPTTCQSIDTYTHTCHFLACTQNQVATPVLGYLTFFCWRATKTYLEIVAEEREEQG